MVRLAKIVIKLGWLFILVNLGVTVFFASQLPKLKINNEMETFIPKTHPVRALNDHLKEVFGDNNVIILALEVKEGTIYQEVILRKIVELTEKLATLAGVEDVTSLANVKNIIGKEEGMVVEKIFDPEAPIDEAVLANVKKVLHSWDFYEGSMITKDDRATVVLIEFPKLAMIAEKAALHAELTQFLQEFSFPEVKLYLAGKPMAEVEMGTNMRGDMQKLIPFVFSIVVVVLILSFRSVLGVLLPISCIAIATINTMGLMAYLGIELTMMGTIIPTVLIAIGSAYSIHVIHHFFLDVHAGIPPKEAIIGTFENVGLSVVLAGLTTMAGFGSLATSEVTPIWDFGVFVAIGTGVALVVALTMIPPVLIFVARFKPSIETKASGKDAHKGMDRLMYQGTFWILKHYKAVVIFGVVLVVVSILSSLRLQSYSDMMEMFPRTSKLRQSNDWMNENLTGTMSLSIIVTGENDSMKEPAVLRQIEDLQRFAERTFPFVSKTTSLVDFIKRMNMSMNGNNPEFEKIPASSELVAQYLLLYSTSGDPGDFDAYVDYDYKQARVMIQSRKGSTLENDEMMKEVLVYAQSHFDSRLKIEASGQVAVSETLVRLIVNGQYSSVAASIGIVLLLMMYIYRSVLGGFLSVLPLSLAILINFAIMAQLGIPLDVGSAIIASIAVGVGIDYAIHYVNNARHDAKDFETMDDLYLHTATTSGSAIMFNALAVGLGFLVLAYSNFPPMIRMGTLVALTMGTSAVGSLVFIPALLKMFHPKFIKLKTTGNRE
ncbi:MMPL family transporter [Deltaproteobacteria bacterium TL4]